MRRTFPSLLEQNRHLESTNNELGLINVQSAVILDTDNSLNATYATALDANNSTQFFSFLEDEESLNNSNNELTSIPNNDNQVVIFKMEGSDQLYGVQDVHDNQGNVHKCQFEVKESSDGQLEAVPNTFELLSGVNISEECEQNNCGLTLSNTTAERTEKHRKLQKNPKSRIVEASSSKSVVSVEPQQLTVSNSIEKIPGRPPKEIFEEKTDEMPNRTVQNVEDHQSFSYERKSIEANVIKTNNVIALKPVDIVSNVQKLTPTDNNNKDISGNNTRTVSKVLCLLISKTDLEKENVIKPTTSQAIDQLNVSPVINNQSTYRPRLLKNSFRLTMPQTNQNNLMIEDTNKATATTNINSRKVPANQQQNSRMTNRLSNAAKRHLMAVAAQNQSVTTILQAPIRKNRLPRKQQITPVKRLDEEIVVKEVLISNNDFIDADDNKTRENPDAYIDLSDSNDGEPHKEKSFTGSKHNPIEIIPKKQGRGRPRKSAVKQKLMEEEEKVVEEQKNDKNDHGFACIKCLKTFPSENSLKTHMHHHTLTSSRSQYAEYNTTTKYNCEKCGQTFKNSILLVRHTCNAIGKKPMQCPHCKRAFQTFVSFKLHVRQHFLQTSQLAKVSPKVLFKALPKFGSGQYQCVICGKISSSIENLRMHHKSHKRFRCSTCSQDFLSILLLEEHVRNKCVKRVVVKPEKTPTPKVNLFTASTSLSSTSSSADLLKSLLVKLPCDLCSTTFASSRQLIKHKIQVHNFQTPNRQAILDEAQQIQRNYCYTDNNMRVGVPLSTKMRAGFAKFINKTPMAKK